MKTRRKINSIFNIPLSRIILIFALIGVLSGCAVKKYPLISVNEISVLKVDGQLPLRRYIIISKSLVNNSRNDEVVKVSQLIIEKNYHEAEIYIQSIPETDQNIGNLCWGLFHFYQKEYAIAYYELSKIEVEEYSYLRHLLLGNCMIEMNNNYIYENFSESEILSEFQKSMDTCHNKKIKAVIRTHIKYVNWGK